MPTPRTAACRPKSIGSKMENIFLKNELNTADRAKALQLFQQHARPRRWPPRVIIATGIGSAKVVFVDRGSAPASSAAWPWSRPMASWAK